LSWSATPPEEDAELLIPSETDTPEVRIGSGGVLAFAAQLIGLAASFLVGVLVARALGPEGKGTLYAIMQVSAILLVALDFGITTSMVHYVSRGEVSAGTATGTALVFSLVAGALGAPVVYLLLRGPLAVVPGVPDAAIFFAVLILPTSLFAAWMWSISMGMGDMVRPLWYSVAAAATTLIALAAMIAFGHATIAGVVAASVAGTVVGVAAILVGLRRQLKPIAVDLKAARARSGFSLRVYLTDLAGQMHNRQDVIILGWLAGAASVGVYSVGTSFAELTWYVPSALGAVIIAKAGRTSTQSGIEYVSRTSRVAIVFMGATVATSALLVPWLVPLLFGSAFAPAVLPFFALIPGVVAHGLTRILWTFQQTQGRLYWREAVAAALFNVVMVLLLVPRMGVVGAALASTVSYMAIGAFAVRRFCADTGARVSDVLVPRVADIKTIAATLRELLSRAS
jgi:O-antigen/teichoic acid export membrane protein